MAVPSKDGSIHITVNYERLDDTSIIGKLPIPRTDFTPDSLDEGKNFTTFDLLSGFFVTSILPASVDLTVFGTPPGLYKWRRMTQGASGAPGTLYCAMNHVSEGLLKMRMYIDDANVFACDPATHIASMRTFLDHWQDHNLKVALAKARASSTFIDSLGFTISEMDVASSYLQGPAFFSHG